MWFKTLTMVVAIPVLAKAVLGLVAPERFYAWRLAQYSATSVPGPVRAAAVMLAALAVVAWYATAFHYVRGGWVITAILSAGLGLALVGLARWDRHRNRGLRAVTDAAGRRRIDVVLCVAGLGLLSLAFRVY